MLRRSLVALLFTSQVLFAQRAAQNAADNAADVARLVAALHLHAGSVVGEIGAGSGELTVAMAREVGADGRVYSNELNATRRSEIARAVERAGLGNVTIVEGAASDGNLPAECCDAIFMRNVYHHFADPPSMNASLLRSLKPGGYIAVIDFTPPSPESAEPARRASDNFHGVYPETVLKELQSAGFEAGPSEKIDQRGFLVAARRPGTP